MSLYFQLPFVSNVSIDFVQDDTTVLQAFIGDIPAYNSENLITYPIGVKVMDRLFTLESDAQRRRNDQNHWSLCCYSRRGHSTLTQCTQSDGQNAQQLLLESVLSQLIEEGALSKDAAVVGI